MQVESMFRNVYFHLHHIVLFRVWTATCSSHYLQYLKNHPIMKWTNISVIFKTTHAGTDIFGRRRHIFCVPQAQRMQSVEQTTLDRDCCSLRMKNRILLVQIESVCGSIASGTLHGPRRLLSLAFYQLAYLPACLSFIQYSRQLAKNSLNKSDSFSTCLLDFSFIAVIVLTVELLLYRSLICYVSCFSFCFAYKKAVSV